MKAEVLQIGYMKYVIRYPKGYEEGKKYPVIIFLHGAGARGTDIQLLLNHPYFQITNLHENFPFVTIAPQCYRDTWFDLFYELQDLVRKVSKEAYTDAKRVYLMGASMGGYATWQLAMSMPEHFAAICPICGGGMYWNAMRLMNVPIWAFHGKLDEVVRVDESVKMVEAVKRCGGNARLTLYPENGHDAWSDTFGNLKVFEWMLSWENKNTVDLIDKYTDSKVYG